MKADMFDVLEPAGRIATMQCVQGIVKAQLHDAMNALTELRAKMKRLRAISYYVEWVRYGRRRKRWMFDVRMKDGTLIRGRTAAHRLARNRRKAGDDCVRVMRVNVYAKVKAADK